MATIKLRGGTAAVWTSTDPVLAAREVGIETDTLKLKVGDGATAWTALGYIDGGGGGGTPVVPASETDQGIVELATLSEALSGVDTARAVTPAGLKEVADTLQPLGSNLTAISAVAMTTYGKNLLVVPNQAALTALLAAGSELAAGILELATTAEAETGTDTTKAVTPAGLAAAILSGGGSYQAASADLDALVALSLDAYGLHLLELTNQAGLMGLLAAASAVASGIVELATSAETTTGTDTVRAVTPAGVQAVRDLLQPLDATGKLAALAGLTGANNKLPYFTGTGTATLADFTAAGRALVDDATAADQLTTLGFSAFAKTIIDDTDAAAVRTTLLLGTAATADTGTTSGTVPLLGASGVLATARLATGTPDGTKYVRDDGTLAVPPGGGGASAASETVSGIAELATQAETNTGTDDLRIVTPLKLKTAGDARWQLTDADLTAIAALVSGANKLPYATGAGTWSLADFTAAGRALVDDADASAQLTTLGVTAFVKTILDDTDAAGVRGTIGAGRTVRTEDVRTGTTSSATPSPVVGSQRNFYTLTAQTVNMVFANPNDPGTFGADGDALIIRLLDAGTHTIGWGSEYRDDGPGLPSSTVAGKIMTLGFIRDAGATKWGLVAKQTAP